MFNTKFKHCESSPEKFLWRHKKNIWSHNIFSLHYILFVKFILMSLFTSCYSVNLVNNCCIHQFVYGHKSWLNLWKHMNTSILHNSCSKKPIKFSRKISRDKALFIKETTSSQILRYFSIACKNFAVQVFLWSLDFLTIKISTTTPIECKFTLKRVCYMIITYRHHRSFKLG